MDRGALDAAEIATLYDVRSAGMCSDNPAIVAPESMPPGIVGQAYAQSLTAALGQPPYAWSLAAGSLPPGLSLSAVGEITGIPASTGSSTFTARLTDDATMVAERQYEISVGSCLMPSAEMAAWWPGEGNGDDWIGTSHGTVGARTYFVPGVRGDAFLPEPKQTALLRFGTTKMVSVKNWKEFKREREKRLSAFLDSEERKKILRKREALFEKKRGFFGGEKYKYNIFYIHRMLPMYDMEEDCLKMKYSIPDNTIEACLDWLSSKKDAKKR